MSHWSRGTFLFLFSFLLTQPIEQRTLSVVSFQSWEFLVLNCTKFPLPSFIAMILKWETSVLYLFAQTQKHVFGNSHLMMSHRVMLPKDTTLRRFVTTHPPAMWFFRRSLLPCLHPLRNTQTMEQSISFSWKLFFFVFLWRFDTEDKIWCFLEIWRGFWVMIMKTKFKFLNAISKVFNFALKIFCFLTQNQIVFFSTNVSDLLSLTMCNLYFSCTLTLKSICTNTLNSLLILFKPLSFLVFLNEPFHEKESPSLPTKIYPEVQNSCVSF